MNDFLFNLSLVLGHTLVYERQQEVPGGVFNDFIAGFGFGLDILSNMAAGKPTIPAFNPIDLGAEQEKAINANQTALGSLETLASGANAFSQDQITAMLEKAVPGYQAMAKQASSNISDELSGKLPKDVQTAIESSDAARALTGGFEGTNLAGNLTARDLGLTSLDLTGKGLDSATRWLSTMNNIYVPGQFNFSSMFITPGQEFAADTGERNSQFQRDYVSNLNDWQHSFGVGVAQDINDTGNTIGQLLSSYLGGVAGGGKREGTTS